MTEAERAFYEWFHTTGKYGVLLENYREAFLAGWNASVAFDEVEEL